RGPKSDRAAPVLEHHYNVLQVKPADELAEHAGLGDRQEIVILRRARQPEPGKVRRDAAKLRRQLADDVPVEKRPGRVAVQQQERSALPLVDVVDAAIGGIDEPACYRE